MTRSKEPSGTYEIGNGRPPVAYQFKKGQSGNPKGRPKGKKKKKKKVAPSFLEALAKKMAEEMTVTESGRSRSVATSEAMAMLAVRRALSSSREAAHLYKLLQQLPVDTETAEREKAANAERTRRKLKDMIQRRKEAERARSDNPDKPTDGSSSKCP